MKKYFVINDSKTESQITELIEKLVFTEIFDGVEIFYFKHLDLEKFILYRNTLLKLKEQKKFEIILHFPYDDEFNFCDINCEKNIEIYLEDIYLYAKELRVKKITFHLGKLKHEDDTQLIKIFNQVMKKFDDLQINYTIENIYTKKDVLKGFNDYKHYKEIFKNVSYCLDLGHLNLVSKNIYQELEISLKDVNHLHFSNNDGNSDQHWSIKKGIIDYKNVYQILKKFAYKESITFEIFYDKYVDLLEDLRYFEG